MPPAALQRAPHSQYFWKAVAAVFTCGSRPIVTPCVDIDVRTASAMACVSAAEPERQQ